MADEIIISVSGSDALPGPTREALAVALEGYGARVLQEARRIERTRRLSPGQAMITDTTIEFVDRSARMGQLPPPPSTMKALTRLGEYVFTLAAGACAGYITKPIAAVLFAVFTLLGVACFLIGRRDA